MVISDGAIVTVGLFALVHTGGFIWWMSRIDTTLNLLGKTVTEISNKMAQHEAIYAKKEDVAKDFVVRDGQINALWKKVDSLQENK